MKRKRKGQGVNPSSQKRPKIQQTELDGDRHPSPSSPVLALYYARVWTLRGYLHSKLSGSSKTRRRLLAQYGLDDDTEEDQGVCRLLDEVVVGTMSIADKGEMSQASQDQELSIFSQQLSESTAISSSSSSSPRHKPSQAEIIDFTIWSLFRRYRSAFRPPHVLCHGFMRSGTANPNSVDEPDPTSIPGILTNSPNEYISMLKSEPWISLPALLGKNGESILRELFIECGIFLPFNGDSGNLLQLSGMPLSDMKPLSERPKQALSPCAHEQAILNKPIAGSMNSTTVQERGLNSIRFVRHRMFYGKPILDTSAHACFGLRQTHILNRSKGKFDSGNVLHVMKYIFPRQFGLHNVFTSDVDPKDTAQPFKDYTLREQEIKRTILGDSRLAYKTPKRLRGDCEMLIARLKRKHSRCSYTALLQHYCPVAVSDSSQVIKEEVSVLDLSTAKPQVSAFCRSVVAQVFPSKLWGEEEAGQHNRAMLMQQIDRFILLRRYESTTLHDVLQNINIKRVSWLAPPMRHREGKLAMSDFNKRKAVFSELVYWLFDSFLVPLINSNFHVTESSAHRNQLFYFRHDLWKRLAEPALTTMKLTMFEELQSAKVRRLLSRRGLGTSHVRLLPKDTGLRPIINLRRRVLTRINGEMVLARSINSILTPAFNVLNYEKSTSPHRLGSSLFSADDMFPRLQRFQAILKEAGHTNKPLYFAKLDVRSCFDTIPQGPLLELLSKLFTAKGYVVSRHAEARVLGVGNAGPPITPKATWKYSGKAQAAGEEQPFSSIIANDAASKRGTVFVDAVVQKQETYDKLLSLLSEHIERNVVRIGKQYYRQRTGIPQGSIVSSLLCSFFYAELEREVLGFLNGGQTLLLRLIDDFLLISTDQDIAARFVQVMHAGIPAYGLSIKREKSRVNFNVEVDGIAVDKLPAVTNFPYCGNAINTVNLHITKDNVRRQKNNLAAAVTVEYCKNPGQSFYRKSLNMLKVHMHAMHLCTAHNGLETVLINLYHAFSDTAERCIHYLRNLPSDKSPGSSLLTKTMNDMTDVAYALMQRKKDKVGDSSTMYECAVTKAQTQWLAAHAFHEAFAKRQTQFGGLLGWLDRRTVEAGSRCDRRLMDRIARGAKA